MTSYPKEHALRQPTQLYSFKGLKGVHDSSDNNQQQTNNANCSTQLIELKKKEIKNTRLQSQKMSNKQKKNQKLEEKVFSQEIKKKHQQRKPSRLRNQPRKNYKIFSPNLKY